MVKENSKLIFLKIRYSLFKIFEFSQIAFYYYRHLPFMKADLTLLSLYLFDSPYSVSRRFLIDKKAENIYTYGETPLQAMATISKACDIESRDHVYELGCGTGRTCFWLSFFSGCKVTGIDYIETFISNANKIKNSLNLHRVSFINQNFLETHLDDATVIYLYGTALQENEIKELIKKFNTLRSGTKIITVSYPLTDYSEDETFILIKSFSIAYPWGSTEVFLQVKR